MPTLQEMLGVTTSPSGEVLPVTSTDDAMDRAYLGPVASEVGNSFLNRLALQTDEMQKDMYTQIGVLGSVLENKFPDTSAALQEFSKKGVEKNIRQIASKPQPTRSVGITDAFTDIKEDFSEGDILEGLERGLQWATEGAATIIPSLGTAIAAVVAAPVVATGTAAGLGAVGVPTAIAGTTAGIIGLATMLSPSFLMIGGSTYDEAKELGSSDKEAEKYAIIAGLGGSLLDRIGAGAVVNSWVRGVGKDKVLKALSKPLGKGTATEIIENAEKVATKEYLKDSIAWGALKAGRRGAGIEALTEAGQEAVQIGSAGLAAGKGLNPYDQATFNKRLIDSAALGGLGGGVASTGIGTVAEIQRKNVARRNEELEKFQEELENRAEFEPDQLAKFIENKKKELKPGLFTDILGRSVTPLLGFAGRSNLGLQVVNRFEQYYNNVSSQITDSSQRLDDAIMRVRRETKIPILMGSVSKKNNDKLYKAITRDEVFNDPALDPEIKQASTIIRDEVLGKIIQPEVKVTRDVLLDALKNDLETLPEIDQVQDPELKATLQENYNTLKQEFVTKRGVSTIGVPVQPTAGGLGFQLGTELEAEKNTQLALREIEKSDSFNQLKDTVTRKAEGSGLFGLLLDAGVKLGFEDNYFPRLYKVGTWRKQGKMKKVMIEHGLPEGLADKIIDNMRGNEGVHMPDEMDVNLDFPIDESRGMPESKESFEERRFITPELFRKLDEAGLVERNVKKVLDKYILQAIQRKNVRELKDFVEPAIAQLQEQGEGVAPDKNEMEQMQNIFSAIQHRYKPFKYQKWKKASRYFLTYQYLLTLPLAALTAMTEPLVVLSRVGSKDAMFGAAQAARNTMRQAVRSVKPKWKKSDEEKAFNSILQGYDGTLAERLGDIAGIDVSRVITDKFFKVTLLTQVTQFSRDMAFQAAQRQMKRDITKLARSNLTGNVTIESAEAKRRLMQQGLLPKAMKLDDPNSEVLLWAEGKTGPVAPELIRKAQSKFVDEVIMAPNVVNRPLWMSNPHFAMVAQLKGFMMTFGNTVGMRAWREIAKPLAKGRIPLDEALRYFTALMLITAASIGIRELKDILRYGDEESPWKEQEGWGMIFNALLDSNIFGPGTVAYDALNASKYGSSPLAVFLGPGPQFIDNMYSAVGQAANRQPRNLSRALASGIPFVSAITPTLKPEITDTIEDMLEELLPGG